MAGRPIKRGEQRFPGRHRHDQETGGFHKPREAGKDERVVVKVFQQIQGEHDGESRVIAGGIDEEIRFDQLSVRTVDALQRPTAHVEPRGSKTLRLQGGEGESPRTARIENSRLRIDSDSL